MAYLLVKAALTGGVVVGISEIAKRSSLFAALLASLPLTTILAMVWLYFDTRNVQSVSALAQGVFWMVLPSLGFFLVFPLLVRWGLGFFSALALSVVLTGALYWGYVSLIRRFGVEI